MVKGMIGLADNHANFGRFEELFWQVTKNMGSIWKEIFDESLPGSQSHILFLLERKKTPLRMSEIAEMLRLTPGAVTSASDKLLSHGYLTRVRSDEDRRVVSIDITDSGKESLSELRKKGRGKMKKVFKDLTDQELDLLIDIFERAAVNIDKIREGENA